MLFFSFLFFLRKRDENKVLGEVQNRKYSGVFFTNQTNRTEFIYEMGKSYNCCWGVFLVANALEHLERSTTNKEVEHDPVTPGKCLIVIFIFLKRLIF